MSPAEPDPQSPSPGRSGAAPELADGSSSRADGARETASSLSVARLAALAWPRRGPLSVAFCALLLGAGLSLVVPFVVGKLVDGLVDPSRATDMDRAVPVLLGLFAIMGLATAARSYLFNTVGERIVTDLRAELFRAMLRQEMGFFEQERTGDLVNRLSADTSHLQSAVTFDLAIGLRSVVSALGALVIMALTSVKLTLIMIVTVPAVGVAAGVYGQSLRKLSRGVQDRLGAAMAIAQERLSGIRTVRAFAREPEEGERFQDEAEAVYELARKRAKLSALFHGGMSFAGYAVIAGVLWFGGRLVKSGDLSVGDLAGFLLYTFTVAFAFATLANLWSSYARAMGAGERVFELLDRRPNMEDGATPLDEVRGALRFEGVTFRYPSRPELTVLDGLELAIEPGEVVALVGPSGAGKSTIAALICRFHDPDEGAVRLDGVDLRELQAATLRARIGVVAQEPTLFAASLRENILYGRPEASEDELREAAGQANALEFIESFPEGFDTLIGERGVRLSGGQKQRVAIARALLEDPPILILDEATSALDAESEHLVREALERLQRGRTTLIIAHRLSTVQGADRVLVLERGRVVQEGRHAELAERDGLYRRLVEHQLVAAAPESLSSEIAS